MVSLDTIRTDGSYRCFGPVLCGDLVAQIADLSL